MPEPQTTITGDANVVGDHSTAIKAEHVYVYPTGGPEARLPAVVEPERPAFRVLTVVARPLDQRDSPQTQSRRDAERRREIHNSLCASPSPRLSVENVSILTQGRKDAKAQRRSAGLKALR